MELQVDRVYRPIEAVPMMGFNCTKSTADLYIKNMSRKGVLKTSYKVNGRWCITISDIQYIRDLIMKGEYKPSARPQKEAA